MRATLGYGCMVYETAAKCHIEKLDRVQHRALRLSLGAIKSTTINALFVESIELPLYLRRTKLSLSYWSRIQGGGNTNVRSIVLQSCWEYERFPGKSLGWVINNKVEKYQVDSIQHSPAAINGSIAPWLSPQPKVNLELLERRREWTERNANIGLSVQEYLKRSIITI